MPYLKILILGVLNVINDEIKVKCGPYSLIKGLKECPTSSKLRRHYLFIVVIIDSLHEAISEHS